jgi:hypothetical protein
MSLFDFFFPDQAQALHLRRLAESTSFSATQARINGSRDLNAQMSMKKRIDELENEVGQLTMIIEALLESISERSILSKEDLARKIGEIDARDGTIDGRITKSQSEPPSKATTRKFNFPE